MRLESSQDASLDRLPPHIVSARPLWGSCNSSPRENAPPTVWYALILPISLRFPGRLANAAFQAHFIIPLSRVGPSYTVLPFRLCWNRDILTLGGAGS